MKKESLKTFEQYKINSLSFIFGGSGGMLNVAIGEDSKADTNVNTINR